MSGLAISNLTSSNNLLITRPQPRPVHFEFDFTKTSTFYLDMWTLLATLGLLVIVALVNTVVFLTWRRQYRTTMAGNDVHPNGFYVPSAPTNISIIDVGKPAVDEECGTTSVTISPLMSFSNSTTSGDGHHDVGLTGVVPVRYAEWPPRAAVVTHQIDKRIILQVDHD